MARLAAAGLVCVGKTNLSELAFSGLGLNPHFGTPPNPLDPARAPGGSSSGSAVAVATGGFARTIEGICREIDHYDETLTLRGLVELWASR